MLKVLKMIINKNIKKLSWGTRYVLLILSRFPIGIINSIVKDITISELANRSSLSEKTVSNHIKELQKLEIIDIERDLIFGKGRGVNTYKLFDKFDSKCTGLHNLIIERILFISDLTPIQKFILINLVSKADDFGVVKGIGFTGLMKMSGVCRNALKSNLRALIDKDFIFDYTSGGNLPVFLGKIKGNFYINFTKYKKNDLTNHTNNYAPIDYSSLEVTQRFNKGFKFIDFDVQEHFNKIENVELKEYLSSLTDHSYSVFFNIITSAVYFYTGDLLTLIRRATLQQNKDFNTLISELKEGVFEVKPGGSIANVDFIKFREVIKNIRGLMWGEIYVDIKKELFKNFRTEDDLSKLRKKIYSEIVFLITYYALRIHLQLIDLSPYPNKYTIVRDFRSRIKHDKGFRPLMILLETKDLNYKNY